jgi:hypothetical protein
MKVRDLASKLQKFHDDLELHYDLWRPSLDQPIPDYPRRNVAKLKEQSKSLARQLGALRPYIEQLTPTTMLEMAGRSWDAYDSAVGNEVAIVKGSSIDAVLPQLQQMLGRLESMNQDAEFSLERAARPGLPQNVNVYNLHGANSRVNIQSEDKSVNVSSITEQQVFLGIRQAVTQGVADDTERRVILEKLDALQESVHKTDFVAKYQAFINSVASHMTIILPFIPALTQMLGR